MNTIFAIQPSHLAKYSIKIFFCLTLPKPVHAQLEQGAGQRVCCVTSQTAILHICLRVGAALIDKFRCVGRVRTATVGVADLMGEPDCNALK